MTSSRFGDSARIALRIVASAVCLAASSGVLAAEGAAGSQDPITFYTNDAAAMAPGGAASQLVQRARAQGQVRVIVMLRIVMRMEHTLAGPEVARQRQALRSVQDGVATRVLGSPADPDVVKFDFIPAMSLFVSVGELQRLLYDPAVVSIQEDVPMLPELDESIPLIHADDVFAKGFNGTGYVVAIVDSGVAKTHPMFAGGKVVRESCYSTNNAPAGLSSVCPGGVTSSIAAGSGVNCPVAVRGCDHGTHVASIAAGNSNVYDGVARDADIIAIQVFTRKANCAPATSPCATSFQTDQISGLQRVYNLRNLHKIAAVNMSYGGALRNAVCNAENPAYTTALSNLWAAGIAPIKSAGNNGSNTSVTFPGCISWTIAVGNATATDRVASSSNLSPLVELMAPGSSINAAVPGGGYAAKTGTSMAAPHVTGSFALLKNAKPTATIAQILAALKCSGKPVDKRNVAGVPEVTPVLPRIDLLGAFNHLRKPPNVLRSWTFSTLDDAKDWAPFRGNWVTSGGLYVQSPIGTGWQGSSVANCNNRLEVTARMRRVDPTIGPYYYNSGIFIKSALNHGAETVSGYWIAFNSVPYCAVTPPPGDPCPPASQKRGAGVVWRATALNFETGAAGAASQLCNKNVEIVKNGFNTIRVISNLTSHTYYLNGKLICTFNDSTFKSGAIVANAFIQSPNTGNYFALDTLTVKSLDTAAPAAADNVAVMDATKLVPQARHPSNGSTIIASRAP